MKHNFIFYDADGSGGSGGPDGPKVSPVGMPGRTPQPDPKDQEAKSPENPQGGQAQPANDESAPTQGAVPGYGASHSYVNETTNLIYQFTGGDVNLRDVSTDKSFAENVAAAAGETARRPWKTEENSFYDNYRRANQIAAVTSFIAGDFHAAQKAEAWEQIDFSDAVSGSDVFSQVGLGFAAENRMNEMLADAKLDSIGANGAVTQVFGSDYSFNKDEIRQLAATGQIDYQGVTLKFGSSDDAQKFAKAYANASIEEDKRSRILSAATTKEKAEALDIIRTTFMSDVRSNEEYKNFAALDKKPENMPQEDYLRACCKEQIDTLTEANCKFAESQLAALNEEGYDGLFYSGVGAIATDGGVPKAMEKLTSDMESLKSSIKSDQNAIKQVGEDIINKQREISGVTNGRIQPPEKMTREEYGKKLEKDIADLKDRQKALSEKVAMDSAALEKKAEVHKSVSEIQEKIDKNKNDISKFEVIDKASKNVGDGKYQNRRAYGARIVANRVVGRDMMFGYETEKRMYKTAAAGIRVIHRASVNAEMKFFEKHAAFGQNNEYIQRYKEQIKVAKSEEELERVARRNGNLKEYRKEKRARSEGRALERSNKNLTSTRDRIRLLEDKQARGTVLTESEQKELSRLKRREKRDKKTSDRIQTRRAERQKKIDKKNQKIDKKATKFQTKLTGMQKGMMNFKTKWAGRIGKISNLVNKLNPANWAKMAFKKFVMAKLAPIGIAAGGAFMAFLLKVAVPIVVIIIALYYISDLVKPTDIAGDLDAGMNGMNFTQVIVNETSSKLATSFKKVAENDAFKHYSEMDQAKLDAAIASGETALKSDKYDWYRGINMGQIDGYYYHEDSKYADPSRRRKNVGVNDNLVPITSMMHFRFLDEINYLQWRTALAYEYYMYVQSHYVGEYKIRKEDDHAKDVLYGKPFVATNYVKISGTTYTITRPTSEICNNIYVHGMDKADYAKLRVEAVQNQGNLVAQFYDSVTSSLGNLWSSLTTTDAEKDKKQGLWIDDWNGSYVSGKPNLTRPSDAVGVCTDAQGVNTGNLTSARKNEKNYDEANWKAHKNNTSGHTHSAACWTCPGYEHEHRYVGCTDENCWKIVNFNWTTTMEQHTHGAKSGDAKVCSYTNCKNSYKDGSIYGDIHTHGDGKCVTSCGLQEHTHSALCCGKEPHTHNSTCTKTVCGVCASCGAILPAGVAGSPAHACPNGGMGYEQYQFDSWSCGHNEEHTHGDGKCDTALCTFRDSEGNPYEHAHSNDCCAINEHPKHTSACCGIAYHEHTPSICYWPSNSTINPKGYKSCAKKSGGKETYGKKEHAHVAWSDAEHPGCYVTLWVCPGHCGGHATPKVDVYQDMDYNSLVYYDNFKVTRMLVEDDFRSSGGRGLFDTNKTGSSSGAGMSDNFTNVEAWKGFWNGRAKEWFSLFPSTPKASLQQLGHSLKYFGACVVDAVTEFFSDAWKWITGTSSNEMSEEEAVKEFTDKINYDSDLFDFKSWYLVDKKGDPVDESGNKINKNEKSPIINKAQLKDLDDMYPSANNYEEAIENWRDIGEVRFPSGSMRPLTTARIEDIMDHLPSNITEERRKVVRAALEAVGMYSFDPEEDRFGSGGRGATDNPKFISDVIYNIDGNDYAKKNLTTVAAWRKKWHSTDGMIGVVFVDDNAFIGKYVYKNGETDELYGDVYIYIGNVWFKRDGTTNEILTEEEGMKTSGGQTAGVKKAAIVHCIPGKGAVIEPMGSASSTARKVPVDDFVNKK